MRLHSRKVFLIYNPNTFKAGKNAAWKTLLMELNCSAICGKQTYFNKLLLSVAEFIFKEIITIKQNTNSSFRAVAKGEQKIGH